MTEDYLQFLWGIQRLLVPELSTDSGEHIEIIRPGNHNVLLAGPDFSHAVIKIDGLEFHGPVEIHVKSSDWYRHGHENDRNYDNVILHVVYENDQPVFQNGRKLPMLELKPYIDKEHFRKFQRFSASRVDIVCTNQLKELDPVFLRNMMQKAWITKVHDKIKTVLSYCNEEKSVLYYFLGAAYGANLNTYPFLQLLQRVPIDRIRNLSPENRYNLLLSESGMVSTSSMDQEQWHFRGNRPGNFPTKRLYQFAHHLKEDQIELLATFHSAPEIIDGFHEILSSEQREVQLTKSFRVHLLINALVPYFVYLSQIRQSERFQDLAFEILVSLPAESNRITRKWSQSQLEIKSAFESQGLLALHRYYCSGKKCLCCEVGNAILKGS